MPERGRSPGAKGTAFPRAQRPQKDMPSTPFKTESLTSAAGQKPALGKPVQLSPKDSVRLSHGDSLRSQKKSANASVRVVRKAVAGGASAARPVAASVTDPDALVRISKLLAERGLCSRREADSYIEKGWVLLDGRPVTELGTKARADARLELAPQARIKQGRLLTVLLNKPISYVSGQPEPGYQPAVVLVLPENQAREAGDQGFDPACLRGLAPAGRLDIDSTGLLVLTQDGRIARQLIGDDSAVEKEYLVRVEGDIVKGGLSLLNHGLSLDGQRLRPAKVEWLNEDQLRFVLREGKKRQIRRMCELVGLQVVGLKRVRIGQVKLGDLPLGQWRYLRPDERF